MNEERDERSNIPQQAPIAEESGRAEQPVLRQNMYDISITPLDFGFIVKVGCKRFAIESKDRLINELTHYINNPSEAYKDWSI